MFYHQIALFGAVTAFVALMTLSCIIFGSWILSAVTPSCYVIAIFMPLFGYGLGYTAASLFNLPDASRRTVGEDFFSVFFEEFIRKLLKEVENFPPMDAILFPGRLRPGKRIASIGRRL